MISEKISVYGSLKYGYPVRIDDFCVLSGKIKIGNYVHISCFTSMTGGGEIIIEDFVGVSQGCRILTASDDFLDWGFGNPTIDKKYRNVKEAPVKICELAIVGANSVICPGVTIGKGASVTANSVVTWNLEPFGIYSNNRKIGERDKEKILKSCAEFNRRILY